jgi:lysophospholipase L1-like esterase
MGIRARTKPSGYSASVRNTAMANGVSLIDLDMKSINFFTALPDPAEDSKKYFLILQPGVYPAYPAGASGTSDKPDNTHFQEAGAEAMAGLVAEGIQENKLPLSSLFK